MSINSQRKTKIFIQQPVSCCKIKKFSENNFFFSVSIFLFFCSSCLTSIVLLVHQCVGVQRIRYKQFLLLRTMKRSKLCAFPSQQNKNSARDRVRVRGKKRIRKITNERKITWKAFWNSEWFIESNGRGVEHSPQNNSNKKYITEKENEK